ncbi:hypothetical protein C8J57DRAFT_1706310 [Mycena rebaudengoi]|nr:hypothetical protein C8J57DRAFT_1706310 [Mycena rebaudengoi]
MVEINVITAISVTSLICYGMCKLSHLMDSTRRVRSPCRAGTCGIRGRCGSRLQEHLEAGARRTSSSYVAEAIPVPCSRVSWSNPSPYGRARAVWHARPASPLPSHRRLAVCSSVQSLACYCAVDPSCLRHLALMRPLRLCISAFDLFAGVPCFSHALFARTTHLQPTASGPCTPRSPRARCTISSAKTRACRRSSRYADAAELGARYPTQDMCFVVAVKDDVGGRRHPPEAAGELVYTLPTPAVPPMPTPPRATTLSTTPLRPTRVCDSQYPDYPTTRARLDDARHRQRCRLPPQILPPHALVDGAHSRPRALLEHVPPTRAVLFCPLCVAVPR